MDDNILIKLHHLFSLQGTINLSVLCFCSGHACGHCFYIVYILSNWLLLVFSFFFIGSIIMRGAGCTWNDFLDKEYDKKCNKNKR